MPDLTFAEVGEILSLLQRVEGGNITLEWGDLKIQVRHSGVEEVDAARSVLEARSASGIPRAVGEVAGNTNQRDSDADGRVTKPKVAADSAVRTPDGWVAVIAPMVGTYFQGPSPAEPPFVEVGDVVQIEDPVALIEVMKLFSELKSEVAGKVVRIDVDDGALVEFGQPLIWIEPA